MSMKQVMYHQIGYMLEIKRVNEKEADQGRPHPIGYVEYEKSLKQKDLKYLFLEVILTDYHPRKDAVKKRFLAMMQIKDH